MSKTTIFKEVLFAYDDKEYEAWCRGDRETIARLTVLMSWARPSWIARSFCSARASATPAACTLEWFRLGNEVSERQWKDVLGVIRVQGDVLDRGYVQRRAAALRLSDVLDRAFAEAARVRVA